MMNGTRPGELQWRPSARWNSARGGGPEVALVHWNALISLISLHSLHLLHHLHHQLSVLSSSLHNCSPSLRRRRRGRRTFWDLFTLWVGIRNPFRSHPVRDDHES